LESAAGSRPTWTICPSMARHTSDPGYTGREVAAGAGWLGVGAVLLVGVVALSVLGAEATLYALGWLLHKVLVAFPRWVARLWS
jgi:hypothetical protein